MAIANQFSMVEKPLRTNLMRVLDVFVSNDQQTKLLRQEYGCYS